MTPILTLNLPKDGGRPEEPDVAKALVMAALARSVEEGGAVIATLESGTLELRLATGEIFHLGEGTVTRIPFPSSCPDEVGCKNNERSERKPPFCRTPAS